MIQVKEMMQDKDLKNSKSKDKGTRSRSQSMNEHNHYKQEKTKTRPKKAKLKCHIFNIEEDKSNQDNLHREQVKPSTIASGSQPSGNTKKDKIQQSPHSTQKNKVEAAHPRTAKSSLKNKNCAIEPKGTVSVKHAKINANFKLIYVKNACMLSDNHDFVFLMM
nr:hypothetical protein [Tanacetum cinerariifolium]